MAPEMRTEPFVYIFWLVLLFGWILMLAAAAALQQDCTTGSHIALTLAGTVGYLGSVQCSKFYGYLWWIVWYVFLLVVLLPVLAAAGSLNKFRGGLLALLALAVMLVGDTANTFLYWNHLGVSSTAASRSRTMVAGTIVASIALYILILIIGMTDEKAEKVETSGEPTGETYGGRYVPKPGAGTTGPTTSPYGTEVPVEA